MITSIHRFIRRRKPMAVPESREQRAKRLERERQQQRAVHCEPEYPQRPEYEPLPWDLFRS